MKESKFYRFIVTLIKPFVKFFYKIEVNGLGNIPEKGGVIICSNHTSNIDPVLLAIIFKRQIYFMAKAELFKNKFFGKLFEMVGAFPVNRGKGDFEAIDNAEKIIRNDNQLGIFIEGTRSKANDFLRPKTGCAIIAYKTNATIIPVCITGANEHKVKMFYKNKISIGKPIYISQLNIGENSSKDFRNASRFIMENIKRLK